MKKAQSLILIIVVTFLSGFWFSVSAETSTNFDWLADVSSFAQELDLSKGNPNITTLGGYGLGTGYAFAIQGVAIPQNALTNIVGPDYEKSEGKMFPPVWHAASYKSGEEYEDFKIISSKLMRVRKTSITISEEKAKNFMLTTISFAPFKEKRFLRIVKFKNTSDTAIPGAFLTIYNKTLTDNAENKDSSMLVSTAGERTMTSSFITDKPASAKYISEPGALRVKIPAIEPGGEHISYIQISFSDSDQKINEKQVYKKLEENYAEWNEWMKDAINAKSSDGYLGDLFDNTLVLLKTQMTADNGALAVMARYSGMWCRDTFGPIRYLRFSGKYEEIKKIASFYDLATRMIGFKNRYPVDLDLTKAPKEIDWNAITPQQGDDPNLLILQYYYYYMATGDKDFIKEHYGFLKRNFTGQAHQDFRLPFHSDETYQVFIMMSETAKMHDFYTADTGFEFTMASAALSEMAEAIGEKEDAKIFTAASENCRIKTEEYYWDEKDGYYRPYAWKNSLENVSYPFANINLRPLWINYSDAADKNARKNLFYTGKTLSRKRTMKSSPKVGYYTGMTPGLLLYNYKSIGFYKRADSTYEGMIKDVASPTGEFAEAYDSKDRWMNYAVEPNIYRPWETSINTEAALYYVTGISYDHKTDSVRLIPHLPQGVSWFEIANLHAGKHVLTMTIKEIESGVVNVTVTNTGGEPVKIELLTETLDNSDKDKDVQIIDFADYGRKMSIKEFDLKPGESAVSKGSRFIKE